MTDETNVYQSPESELEHRPVSPEQHLASTGQRFANLLLDTFFYYVFAFLIGLVLGIFGLLDRLEELNVAGELLFGIIIVTLYFWPQEALTGRTLAKRITRTCVVNEHGGVITPMQALARTLCRFIPFEAFSFLGGNGKPVGWHDRIPNTRVISLR